MVLSRPNTPVQEAQSKERTQRIRERFEDNDNNNSNNTMPERRHH